MLRLRSRPILFVRRISDVNRSVTTLPVPGSAAVQGEMTPTTQMRKKPVPITSRRFMTDPRLVDDPASLAIELRHFVFAGRPGRLQHGVSCRKLRSFSCNCRFGSRGTVLTRRHPSETSKGIVERGFCV